MPDDPTTHPSEPAAPVVVHGTPPAALGEEMRPGWSSTMGGPERSAADARLALERQSRSFSRKMREALERLGRRLRRALDWR
jgi:hypothetical protein